MNAKVIRYLGVIAAIVLVCIGYYQDNFYYVPLAFSVIAAVNLYSDSLKDKSTKKKK